MAGQSRASISTTDEAIVRRSIGQINPILTLEIIMREHMGDGDYKVGSASL